jgi:hypothetical protein
MLPRRSYRLAVLWFFIGVFLFFDSRSAEAQALFPCPQFSVSGNIAGATRGDFNEDGIVDIATAASNGLVSLLLAQGDGTFALAQEYPAGSQLGGIATADLNGDGRLDLVVTETANPSVRILLGAGNGLFLTGNQYGALAAASSLVLADFDGNGTIDIAVAYKGADNAPDNRVQVLPGVGDGTFLSARTYTVGSGPSDLAATDLNRDGFPDLITANYGNAGNGNEISVLLNTGTGDFQPAQNYEVTKGPSALATGDVNQDGFMDVMALCKRSNRVHLLRGKGDGTFYPRTGFATGSQPTGVELGDINGDGRLDLLVLSDGAGFPDYLGTVSVYLGAEYDIFVYFGNYVIGLKGKIFLEDFTGDTLPDVAVVFTGFRSVGLLKGHGDGTLLFRQDYPPLNGVQQMRPLGALVLEDFNGDTLPDLMVSENSSFKGYVLLGNADGSFRPGMNVTLSSGPIYLASGDFNGDGKKDVAAASNFGNSLKILLGNGDGTFQAGNNYTIDRPDSIAVGDFNGDSHLDVVVSYGNRLMALFRGNGDGTFQPPVNTQSNVDFIAAVADVNRDGRPDVITTRSFPNTLSVLLGAGDGTFPVRHDYSTTSFTTAVTVGDWNGDGNPDLAVADRDTKSAGVLIGRGNGTFLSEITYPGGGFAYSITHGDVNGDGILDLVMGVSPIAIPQFADGTYGSLSILLGVGDGTFQARTEYTLTALPSVAALYDFNHDGWQDIVTANAGFSDTSGSVTVLFNLGTDQAIVSGNIQTEGIAPSAPSQLLTFTFRPEDGSAKFTRQVSVSPAGTFHLTHIPRKRYILHIKGAKWLATNVLVDVTSSDLTDVLAALHAGDANNDNSVDVLDLDLLIRAFDSTRGDPQWNTGPDFNCDGSVDVLDLDLLIRNFDLQGAD